MKTQMNVENNSREVIIGMRLMKWNKKLIRQGQG